MKNKWIRQLAWAGIGLSSFSLINSASASEIYWNTNAAELSFEQQRIDKIVLRSLRVPEILQIVSKQEKIYFAYADVLIEKLAIGEIDPLTVKLSSLPKILARANLRMVKISDKQYVIEKFEQSTSNTVERTPLSKKNFTNQQYINGTVTDTDGKPLTGVTVKVLKGTTAVRTDIEGKFNIEAAIGSTLQFNLLGYQAVSREINSDAPMMVQLITAITNLDEVIVVGYGTQKKADLTGSVGIVDVGKSLKSRPVTNVQELLAGTIPGVNVSKGSGAVGSGASINIRGTSTIGGSSGALVLIDGVPGNINTLNPNDIESVSILKDASSASIYGSRAANGVILVTTKSGQAFDKLSIEVNTGIGIQSPQQHIDFVGSEDFMKLWDQALVNDGKAALYGEKGLQDLHDGKYANVKWYEEIYKKNRIINNNYLSLSGNNERVKYRFSASHDFQNGTLPNNKYNRIILKPDMTFHISEKIDARANIQYTETYIDAPQGGTEIWQTQAMRVAPIYSVQNQLGQYGPGSSMVNNPIAGVYQSGFNRQKYKELLGIFELTYKPIEDLELKGNFSRYTFDNWSKNRVLSYNLYDDAGNVVSVQNRVTNLTDGASNNYRNMLQFTGTYKKDFGDHHFKLLGGYSQEYFNTSGFTAFRDNLPFPNIDVLNSGAQTNMISTGDANDVAIQSYFSRLNYDYKGKYLFQANVRADGSSRFAAGNRWGVFPSFSAGWNIHQEDFFHADFLSTLKLRGSWGILGDAEKVGYYATATVLTYDPAMYGFNGVVVPGAWNNVSINPNISWEESKQTNLAVDLGLFNKVNITAEYFINNRDNILYAPPVPTEFGLAGPLANLLSLRSQGMEFQVGYNDRKNDWYWSVDANASFSKNKVKNLAGTGPWIGSQTFTNVGYTYNLPYGYQAEGLFQSETEIANSASQGANIFPGNIKYKDQDGNGVINGDDRVILRDKPVIRYGLNLGLGWKNLDISVNMYGALQNTRYISGYEGWAFFLTQNARPMHLDNWTPENPNASYPRLSLQYTSNDTQYSDYWLRKANYLKIQNAQIGYTFPANLLSSLKIASLRAFVSAQNLATITDYKGFDPEGSYYPISRTFSFGVNLKF
ncbi:TonB-dependent receptor [Sphingobacterium ginsenosidimutans]|uniref:TonB-dependent receptor n=1 Tax=Sphingobacterium ginsenosidimutans TaxID=687845 RepID=A0ABP7ZWS4_9SPHI